MWSCSSPLLCAASPLAAHIKIMTNDNRTPAGTKAGGEFATHTRPDGGDVIESPELTAVRERIGHAETRMGEAARELSAAVTDALKIIVPATFPGAKRATFFRRYGSDLDAFKLNTVNDDRGKILWSSNEARNDEIREIDNLVQDVGGMGIDQMDRLRHKEGELVGLNFE